MTTPEYEDLSQQIRDLRRDLTHHFDLHDGANTGMTPDEYQKAALSFKNPDTLYDAQRDNAVLGLVGEAGEIADKLKKHLFHGDADKHPFGPARCWTREATYCGTLPCCASGPA
jgi:hypothetical protein